MWKKHSCSNFWKKNFCKIWISFSFIASIKQILLNFQRKLIFKKRRFWLQLTGGNQRMIFGLQWQTLVSIQWALQAALGKHYRNQGVRHNEVSGILPPNICKIHSCIGGGLILEFELRRNLWSREVLDKTF